MFFGNSDDEFKCAISSTENIVLTSDENEIKVYANANAKEFKK